MDNHNEHEQISPLEAVKQKEKQVASLKDKIADSVIEKTLILNFPTYVVKKTPPVDEFVAYLDGELELSHMKADYYKTARDIGNQRAAELVEMRFSVAKKGTQGREGSKNALKKVLLELEQYYWDCYRRQNGVVMEKTGSADFLAEKDKFYRLQAACTVPGDLLAHYGFPEDTVR